MRTAFWRASTLARPLHALQQWWQDQKKPTCADHNGFSASMGMLPCPTVDRNHLAANHGNFTEGTSGERMHSIPISCPLSTLAPAHLYLPYILVAPPAVQKIHRTANRSTAVRRHGAQRQARILNCSASTQEAGHFFISGRVADVCAELERLAAREAAH